MITRELRESVKFKQSIHNMKRCHLQDTGEIKTPHKEPAVFTETRNSLLGTIIQCSTCESTIFMGHK
mgnify:CR=1 FL=1